MDADITGMADQVMGDGALQQLPPARPRRAADDDMGEVVGIGISDDLARRGERRQDDRFGAKLFGKPHIGGQPVLVLVREVQFSRRFQMQCRPWRTQPVGLAAGVTHEACTVAAMVEADQNTVSCRPGAGNRMRLHVVQELLVHPLGGAAQGKFAQGRQVAGGKVVFDGTARGGRHIDLAIVQALDEVVRCYIDDLDIVGAVDDQVRHRFPHADARDLGDDIVQAFDMLDVERRIDVDAAGEDFLHIHVALRMTTAARIGMGKFIDEDELRAAGKDGVEIHLVELLAAIVDQPSRHDLETIDQRLGFLAAMGFDDADDDIEAICKARPAGHQHFIGLADAGGRTEKDLQPAATFLLGMLKESFRRGPGVGVAAVVRHKNDLSGWRSFSLKKAAPYLHPHSCACHRNPASPSPWAERARLAAQTRVGWIPVTSTGMREQVATLLPNL